MGEITLLALIIGVLVGAFMIWTQVARPELGKVKSRVYTNACRLRFINTLYGTAWAYRKRNWNVVGENLFTEEVCQIGDWFRIIKREGKSLVDYAKTTEERKNLAYDLDILKHNFTGMVAVNTDYFQKSIWGESLEYLQDQQAALLMLLNQAGQPINEAQKQRQEAIQQAETESQDLTNIGGRVVVFKDQGRATAFRLEYVPKGDYSIRFGERSVEMATSDGKMDVPINLFSSTPLASGRLVITSLQNQQTDEVLW